MQGLNEGVLLVYIMEMKKAQEKLNIEGTENGEKNVNAQGFDRTVSQAWYYGINQALLSTVIWFILIYCLFLYACQNTFTF